MCQIETVLTVLKSEHGKALECYERSLLYSYLPVTLADDNHLYIFPQTEGAYKEAITTLYILSVIILRARHEIECGDLDDLRSVSVTPLPESDRDVEVMRDTVEHVSDKFGMLVNRALLMEGPDREIGELSWIWLGLNNICYLLMDEISHLNERMDQAHTRIAARQAANDTAKSIQYATIGIGVSAWLTLVAIFTTIIVAGI